MSRPQAQAFLDDRAGGALWPEVVAEDVATMPTDLLVRVVCDTVGGLHHVASLRQEGKPRSPWAGGWATSVGVGDYRRSWGMLVGIDTDGDDDPDRVWHVRVRELAGFARAIPDDAWSSCSTHEETRALLSDAVRATHAQQTSLLTPTR